MSISDIVALRIDPAVRGWVLAVAVADVDGRPVIVTGGDDGTVRRWDATTGQAIGDPLTGHTDWVRAVAVGDVDGRPVIVTGGSDGTVRRWDATTGQAIGDPLTGHTGWVRAVAVSGRRRPTRDRHRRRRRDGAPLGRHHRPGDR